MEKKKKMKVIVLKGRDNSGKTTTLKKVHEFLMKAGGEQETNYKVDLKGNDDFRDVINFAGKKIGIVTQGDYGKKQIKQGCDVEKMTAFSVGEHLEALDRAHCDVAICACTTGKNIEKTITKDYPEATPIDKEIKSLQEIENTLKAMEIIQILNLWLLDATK